MSKNTQIISKLNSVFTEKISINSEIKHTNENPSNVIQNYTSFMLPKKRLDLKKLDNQIKSIKKYNDILLKYKKINNSNSLLFLNEIHRKFKTKGTTNKKQNIQSLTHKQNRNENLLKIKNYSKYIDNNLSTKYIDNNLSNIINFPVNLLVNKTNTKFKLRNYIRLFTKFNPNLASQKINLFKFNLDNTKIYKNIYTILHSAFISMHCLISKPRLYLINDKIIIQLFIFADRQVKKILKKFLKNYLKKNRNFKFLNKFRYRNKKNIKINNFIKFNKFNNKNKKKFNKINIFNYKSPFLAIFNKKLNHLCQLLSILFKKPVQLELIRLHYPFYDTNIFANYLAQFATIYKFTKIYKKFFNVILIKKPTASIQKKRFSLLPAYLTGLSIKFAGRVLASQKVVPKKTVRTRSIGSLARKKALLVENARFSNKNRRGAFSISISSGAYLPNILK